MIQQVRQEFVHNLVTSDYILLRIRNGNFSYRLYETLSCGGSWSLSIRIASCLYDFAIDWNQFCVWVDQQ